MDRSTLPFGVEKKTLTGAESRRSVDADRLAFAAFSARLRDELAPRGTIETIQVDRVILAAWRLGEAVEAKRVGVLEGIGADSADLLAPLDRDLRRQSDRAACALARALDDLASIRRLGWGQAAPLDTTVPGPDVDEVAVAVEDDVPASDDLDDDFAADEGPADDDAPLPRWSDRLVYDPNVSDDSPVVRGTWVTVSQVVSLIVDGGTWADVLRSHPELNEDDLRACLAFAHEQETDDGRSSYGP